jgi:UDP-N-acetylglucosamine 4-epimerase
MGRYESVLNQLRSEPKTWLVLPRYPHLQGCKPVYRDFRKGDVLHSQADISKAADRLGYEPSHTIESGLDSALPWYIANLQFDAVGNQTS